MSQHQMKGFSSRSLLRSMFLLSIMIIIGLIHQSEALQLRNQVVSPLSDSGEMIKASSPLFTYRNGRFLREGDAIMFDWSGFIISTHFLFSQNASMGSMNKLNSIVHVSDVGNLYNANLWRLDSNGNRVKYLQTGVLTTNNADQGFNLNFVWPLERDVLNYVIEIELEKRTEAMLGVVKFYGITFLQNVKPVEMDKRVEKVKSKVSIDGLKIEFIGDSITCAYGNMGKAPCAYTPATQNVHESFVEMTARYVNATEIHVECWSGKGVVRNYADKNTTSKDPFPVYYPRILANNPSTLWDFKKSFIPDIAVITLGTNDFSTPPRPSFDEFSNGYQQFIDFIFGKYAPLKGPSFKLVMVSVVAAENYGDYIQSIAERQPGYGKNVFFANLRDIWRGFGDNDWGCSGHPNVNGDAKLALALSSFISKNVL